MAANLKRSRMEDGSRNPAPWKKGKKDNRNYYARAQNNSHKKNQLRAGQRGFLVTCNYREQDCIRDSYRLLNEYADEMYGKLDGNDDKITDDKDHDEEEEEEDISVLVEKQAEAARTEKRRFRFESVDTGTTNCLFITTILEDPKEIVLKILNDLVETKLLKSRSIIRMLPIEAVTKANVRDIMDTAGKLFDKYFLGPPKTFAILFNRRYNNSLQREVVVGELAKMITTKNVHNKANLKQPELAVVLEVIKGVCLIGVLPQYYEYRKYNLSEICGHKYPSRASEQEGAENKDETVEEATKKGVDKKDEIVGEETKEGVDKKDESLREDSKEDEKSSDITQAVTEEKPTETVPLDSQSNEEQ